MGPVSFFITGLTIGCVLYPFLVTYQKLNIGRFYPEDKIGILFCFITAMSAIIASVSYAFALKTYPAGLVAAIVAINPIITLIISIFVFNETINLTKIIGIITAIVGIIIISV